MHNTMTKTTVCCLAAGWLLTANLLFGTDPAARSNEPAKGATKQVDLGGDVTLELAYIPPGEFTMGSSAEEPYFVEKDPRPVCRGGNYFDVPGNARCAVRLGLRGPSYSDSRDGFRICLGVPQYKTGSTP